MLRTSAAMLPSPSTLRSLLHLSRRSILLPNPRLPSPALLADLRLLSSSPSPSDGGGWSGSHNPLAGKEAVKGKRTLNLGRGVVRWSVVAAARRGGPGKAAKANVSYVCSNCGEGSSQWWGMCCHCKAMGTLTKYVIPEPDSASDEGSQSHHALRSWIPQKSKEMVPLCLPDVTKGFDQAEWRIPLPGNFGMEIARVLGGGIVPGSLTLVGGDPGVGKSSLMLQLASMVSDGSKDHEPSPVVYVSGEESIEQIGNRAERMSLRSRHLYLYSSTDIEISWTKSSHYLQELLLLIQFRQFI